MQNNEYLTSRLKILILESHFFTGISSVPEIPLKDKPAIWNLTQTCFQSWRIQLYLAILRQKLKQDYGRKDGRKNL